LDAGEITPRAQDASQASLAPRMKKEDGVIDWSRSSQEIYNRIRGLAPWPGAYTTFRGKLCHVWGQPSSGRLQHDYLTGSIVVTAERVDVACGGGSSLHLEAVQIEGRKRVSAREFANGARLASRDRFGH
jgi:methionyl-tRNA formyltransferase